MLFIFSSVNTGCSIWLSLCSADVCNYGADNLKLIHHHKDSIHPPEPIFIEKYENTPFTEYEGSMDENGFRPALLESLFKMLFIFSSVNTGCSIWLSLCSADVALSSSSEDSNFGS
jgi:hypothetical protein